MRTDNLTIWAESTALLESFRSTRRRTTDLYTSEARFLPWIARRASTVLDVGCALGGFRNIWKDLNPKAAYYGVDISMQLTAQARLIDPASTFVCADCAVGLPFPDSFAVATQALGWIHWEPLYAAALSELWRVTKRYLFFDARVIEADEDIAGHQRLLVDGMWDGQTKTPYITVAWAPFAKLLLDLNPKTILAYGYYGSPATGVIGVADRVCFAAFVLEKRSVDSPTEAPEVCAELPFEWPSNSEGQIHRARRSLNGILS